MKQSTLFTVVSHNSEGYLFNILYNKMGSTQKALLLHTKVQQLFPGRKNKLCDCSRCK